MESLSGRQLLRYRIMREIGRGGMGVVYEAKDTSLGRRVAIKFLSAELQENPAILERFRREARAASALNHPGICTIHAIESEAGKNFIVMELLEGVDLAERLASGPLQLPVALELAIELVDALETAHAKGVIHRDLKPANIFIGDHGHLKVLDFGLAKFSEVEHLEETRLGAVDRTMPTAGALTEAGAMVGTVAYMSPEQARGQPIDARTDLFSCGAVIYQMLTGARPFEGLTRALVFDALLNHDPRPATRLIPELPARVDDILARALAKDRARRYTNASELKGDLLSLRRELETGNAWSDSEDTAPALVPSTPAPAPSPAKQASEAKSVAVLYFENPSHREEDEYFRDGITEDIITELSKIAGLRVFSRMTVFPYRDKPITPAQLGQELDATYVLAGSVRRSGKRLRITTQLVDVRTDYLLWSERYDRLMDDVFEVQDEIARKIAEAMRVKLSPEEQQQIAAKPTRDAFAYDFYLRGRSFMRRQSRQDLDFALQMYESAIEYDPNFALAHAAIAMTCSRYYYRYGHGQVWSDRAEAATARATELRPGVPEVELGRAWLLFAQKQADAAVPVIEEVIAQSPDCDGAHELLLRALFVLGRHGEIVDLAEQAMTRSGEDWKVASIIGNAMAIVGDADMNQSWDQRCQELLDEHLDEVPEDAGARMHRAGAYAKAERFDEAMRELSLATHLRPNDATLNYNAACTYCHMGMKREAMAALRVAWRAGMSDGNWARRDPDLVLLHDEPEFNELYPPEGQGTKPSHAEQFDEFGDSESTYTRMPERAADVTSELTQNSQALDFYSRGLSYARLGSRQELEFALQMFESAVRYDAEFAVAYAAIARTCARRYYDGTSEPEWLERGEAAAERASELQPRLPDVLVAEGWIHYVKNEDELALPLAREAVARAPKCDGGYELLLRLLFRLGRYQEVVDLADAAIDAHGDDDWKIHTPISNALGALGDTQTRARIRPKRISSLEHHLRRVPEDAGGRMLLAGCYAEEGRGDDAMIELKLAITLRPSDTGIQYNAACTYAMLGMRDEALECLAKAKQVGMKDGAWARSDPDLASLHGDPEFERMFPS